MTLDEKLRIGCEYNAARKTTNVHQVLGAWRKDNYPGIPQSSLRHYSKLHTAYNILAKSDKSHEEIMDTLRQARPTAIYQLQDITVEAIEACKNITLKQEEEYFFYVLRFGNFYKLGVASDMERRRKEHEYHLGSNTIETVLSGSRSDILHLEHTLKWMFRDSLGEKVGLSGEETFKPSLLLDVLNAVNMLERGVK